MEQNAIKDLLAMQYGNAAIEVIDVSAPDLKRVFYREAIEELIPLLEADKLTLVAVRLTKDFIPLTMEWRLEAGSESKNNLETGEAVKYKYQVAGNFEPIFSGQMTVLMKEYYDLETGDTSFGDTVAQYNNEKEDWEYQ